MSLVVEYRKLVAAFTSTTLAAPILSPAASETVPRIAPVPASCARAGTSRAQTNRLEMKQQ
jgi:hypothetical protein